LDLSNPADLATAAAKVCAENPDLYKRYRDAKHRARWLALTD